MWAILSRPQCVKYNILNYSSSPCVYHQHVILLSQVGGMSYLLTDILSSSSQQVARLPGTADSNKNLLLVCLAAHKPSVISQCGPVI